MVMHLQVEIIDPKAKRLLEDLEDLGVIRIRKDLLKEKFGTLLKDSRVQGNSLPTMNEIIDEVEQVRSVRYKHDKQKKQGHS